MNFLSIPKRVTENRKYGITSIIDHGTPFGALKDILENYHPFIDIAKFAIGTAYIEPNLQKKVDLYKKYNIKPYFGGTLFEKCYKQRKLPEYLDCLQELGIEYIEISTGTLHIPLQERLQFINKINKDFYVIAEVGSKDPDEEMSISDWKIEINQLMEAGCEYVITEGRDSGTSGIYQKNGSLKSNLIQELVKDIDTKKVIFEAPTNKQQMYFINEIGPNVNLGNVKLNDVLLLEAQRCGLRCETFFMEESEPQCKLPL